MPREELGNKKGTRITVINRTKHHLFQVLLSQLATIGRSHAIFQFGRLQLSGFLTWLIIHTHYLIGFKNRVFVTINWAWSFFIFRPRVHLIISKE
ncbi:MAG: hypothetical protein C0613_11635 [Desulfobulbaceae bacterium]|nr:MAG: hypothetical protein C0613_11635 [Desulfobulbaceae bacterium]